VWCANSAEGFHDEDAHILFGEESKCKIESFFRWSSDRVHFNHCVAEPKQMLPPFAHYRIA